MDNIFSKRLKELRIEKNLKQSDLAQVLKVSSRTISFYENGKRECNFNTLLKISDYFGVSIDYLLGKTDY